VAKCRTEQTSDVRIPTEGPFTDNSDGMTFFIVVVVPNFTHSTIVVPTFIATGKHNHVSPVSVRFISNHNDRPSQFEIMFPNKQKNASRSTAIMAARPFDDFLINATTSTSSFVNAENYDLAVKSSKDGNTD
jgi:hypothetical protein